MLAASPGRVFSDVPRIGPCAASHYGYVEAVLKILLISAALVAGVAAPSARSGQPGLGVAAGMYWNIDALVHDNFGSARVCVRHSFVVMRATSTFCPAYYVSLFPSARKSSFSLVVRSSNPLAGLNVIPVRFKSRSGPYVSCGGGRWLALTNARSQLWPVGCIRR
jgi:hypothetical protein